MDFSDSTLRCLKAYESMYPCLLHESTGAFGGEFGYNLDTRIAIQLRQKLFQDGSLYQIVKIGSSMQMCVGRLSADGQYGVMSRQVWRRSRRLPRCCARSLGLSR
mgnify:CR=1 FL=1